MDEEELAPADLGAIKDDEDEVILFDIELEGGGGVGVV